MKQEKKTKKPFSCTLHVDTIDKIRYFAESHGISQAVTVAKAIHSLVDADGNASEPQTEHIHHSDDPHSEFWQSEIEFKNREIAAKNDQINKLLESVSQSNHLLALFKKDSLIEHKHGTVDDHLPEVVVSKSKKDKKKKKKKGKSK